MIYDCFTFFNELDLLEIRMNTLNSVVDKFVLVEATRTHQGKEKPLHYAENKARYAAFADKIIHVVVDEYPPYEGESAWVLEHHQRNMISKGLKDCKPNDTVLISDVDEIPDPKQILHFKDKSGIKIFRQKMYYYFINCMSATYSSSYRWNGTIMANYNKLGRIQDLRELSMQLSSVFHVKTINRIYWRLWKLRNTTLKGKKIVFIPDGGWHFSYLGGEEMILKKLEAFAHTEYNKAEYKNIETIRKAIKNGDDIFGRDFRYKNVPLDNSFPKYIVENKQKFARLISE